MRIYENGHFFLRTHYSEYERGITLYERTIPFCGCTNPNTNGAFPVRMGHSFLRTHYSAYERTIPPYGRTIPFCEHSIPCTNEAFPVRTDYSSYERLILSTNGGFSIRMLYSLR